jgi:hypothetical protein
MFITNEIEFEAAMDQLADYMLIENPTDEEKKRHSELAVHAEKFVIAHNNEQEVWH